MAIYQFRNTTLQEIERIGYSPDDVFDNNLEIIKGPHLTTFVAGEHGITKAEENNDNEKA